MRINGSWVSNANGVLEPVLRVAVESAPGEWIEEAFLVDSGAEQTVLSPELIKSLDVPRRPSLNQLIGIGGVISCLTVTTRLRLQREDGLPAMINGPFDGIPEGREGELSILGRDVLGNFALILDRPGRVISLLHGQHWYAIHEV